MERIERHTQLDGLRGYAALAVVIYHSILVYSPGGAFPLWPPVQDIPGTYQKLTKIVVSLVFGDAAVTLFFILSGLVLFESLRRQDGLVLRSAYEFSVRRFFRIYPALIVCLVVCLATYAAAGMFFAWEQFRDNALLYDFPIHGASWTLQVEFLAVPFVLASYWCYRGVGIAGLLGVYLAAWAALHSPWLKPYLFYLRSFLVCFTLGFLIPTGVGALVKRLPDRTWPISVGLLLLSWMVVPSPAFARQLLNFSAMLLVAQLYYGRAGALGTFLANPASRYLGRISYSFYLFNVALLTPIAVLLTPVAPVARHPLEYGLATAAVVIVLTLPVAHFSERFIEQPGMRVGRWAARLGRWRTEARVGRGMRGSALGAPGTSTPP